MATSKTKPKKNASTFEDGGIQFQRCQHTVPLEEHIVQMRSVLDKNEEDLKAARQQMSEMERRHEEHINRLSDGVAQAQQEVQASRERAQRDGQPQHEASKISWITSGLQTLSQNVMSTFGNAISSWFGTPDQDFSMLEIQNYYRQEVHMREVALQEKWKEAEHYKHSLSEREHYVQRKMEEARKILQQKDEELKSFKDRVAGDVALSIKTGKAESMNNPVSKTRLKEMYEELRTLWPTIKKHLKSNNKRPESVKAKLQEIFAEASAKMEQQKSRIDNLYGLDEPTSRPIYQKVHEYRKATIQYLQLTLYHNGKEEAESKSSLLQSEGSSLDVMEFLVSQCQWFGILMALNDPPLQPDWKNHDPGMNEWDILPRNLHSSTAL